MTLGILGAMSEELAPLLERYSNHETFEIAANKYHKVSLEGGSLVLAYSKIGKVHAALSASVMILHFGCEGIIFSGVAGALDENLKIGDLLIATKLCQHDVDITSFGHARGLIPEGRLFYESDSRLCGHARSVARDLGIDVKEGVVASGDQFIADFEAKAAIAKEFGAAAVEMEGASVACVCSNFSIPFCVFRCISDAADKDAGFNFDAFLQTSAKRSASMVASLAETILKKGL